MGNRDKKDDKVKKPKKDTKHGDVSIAQPTPMVDVVKKKRKVGQAE